MKILLAVHFVKIPYDIGNIFISAWNNWMRKYKKDVECDIVFCSGYHTIEELRTLAPSCDLFFIPPDWESRPDYMGKSTLYAEGLNIPTILFPGKDYDFIFRIDHDAFLTVETLNDLCRYIRANTDVDYISASHNPRKYHSKEPKIIEIHEKPKKDETTGKVHKSYAPHGIPGNNGDFWGINKEFCLRWVERYENDMCIPRRGYIGYTGRSCPQPYFITYLLNFEKVCEALGYPTHDLEEDVKQGYITMDGCFGTDAWTHFCAMSPIVAGIVDKEGRSFRLKGSPRELPDVLKGKFKSYNEIRDPEDTSFPFAKNVRIDNIFHIENGYISYWHWNSFNKGTVNPLCKMFTHFVPNAPDTFYICQRALMKILCDRFGTEDQKDQLKTNFNKLCRELNVNMTTVNKINKYVDRYYLEPLLSYL